MNRDVVVQGQSKSTQSAEKWNDGNSVGTKMLNSANEVSEELLDIIELVSVTFIGLKG